MYDLFSTKELPRPRIQFVWVAHPTFDGVWFCHYQLVLNVQPFDIRREGESLYGDYVIELEPPTRRSSNQIPCILAGQYYPDLPFRSGRHGSWDSFQLGGLPVFVRSPNGVWLHAERVL